MKSRQIYNPRPPGCVQLKGEARAYRVRVGNHRLVYEVFDDQLLVHVIVLGRRSDIYRH